MKRVLPLILCLLLLTTTGLTVYVKGQAPEKVVKVYDGNTLANAVREAVDGQTIKIMADIEIGKIEIKKAITIEGEGGVTVTVLPETNRINTGATHGFYFVNAIKGTSTLRNLTIKGSTDNLALIHVANTDPLGCKISVENCTLYNVGNAPYNDAISFEYFSGPTLYYFDLSVTNCNISANSYGIGSGLNNGNANVSNCSLNVSKTNFNISGASSIYGIHAPNAFKKLTVVDCVFKSAASGGIKYVFNSSNRENVKIKNNDFSQCNKNLGSYSYAIMCTNTMTDLADPYCYCWATDLSGNDFRNQNALIAVRAELEVFWFPDGQAVNDTRYNNLNQVNITNEGTRYAKSNYGGSALFKEVGVNMTDFAIDADQMSFTLGEAADTTAYHYNTVNLSGFYTNSLSGVNEGNNSCWTEGNPRHCAGSIASWTEANRITRWSLGNSALIQETTGIYTAEDDIAKVMVNTETGVITVTPKAIGTTTLAATVGGGDLGILPNAKKDTLVISVGDITFEDDEIPQGAPTTGDSSQTFLWLALMSIAAAGMVTAFAVVKYKNQGKNQNR